MSGASRMLWQSCVIAVVVLAVLSSLISLRSKSGKGCSGNYRRRAETSPERNMLEAVMPEHESDGLHTLAAAFCFLAAGAHSKDPADQEQIGASFYDMCLTGCEGVKINPAIKAFVDGMLSKKAPKR